MALAKIGEFYYPCRLIIYNVRQKSWTVKFWRGNIPALDSAHNPGKYATINESDLIDALWHNRSERRLIKV